MKIRHFLFLLISMVYFSFPHAQAAENIDINEISSKVQKATEEMKDFSGQFITNNLVKDPIIEKLEKRMNGTFPNKTSYSVWIKKPYMKRDDYQDTCSILKRDGEELIAEYYFSKLNRSKTEKLPLNAWPSWPSPEVLSNQFKEYVDKKASYQIEEKNDEIPSFIISFQFKDEDPETILYSKIIFYVNKSDWLVHKIEYYKENTIIASDEWKNVSINTAFSDDIFNCKKTPNASGQ